MACVAVISLMRTLELEFLQSNPRLIFHDRQHIISLHENLGFLQTFLDESEKKADNYEELKEVTAKIREVVLKAEYDIEAELIEIHDETLHQTLRRVLGDVEQLMEMTKNAKYLQIHEHQESSSSSSSGGQSSPSQATSKSEDDTMVGHAKEFEELKGQLLRFSNETLQVMALFGMGGIGKTTFARKVYDDSVIKSCFDRCGWATMSQDYNKRQVLIELCRSVMPMWDDMRTKNDDELAEELQKSLKGWRYLIIVDDIWTKQAWDDVRRCFPSETTSSRILLTTRLKDVADYACSGKLSHEMRFLDSNESWNLFCQKVLINKEFERIGRRIVESCRGLPLTVVVLAGHLSNNIDVDKWKSIESTLNSLVNLDLSQQFLRILNLSYNNLPCHLKSCFLYLGAFPEDSEIEIKKVIRLWIAEGFIKEVSEKTLEESGEEYLHDLINRSLIMKSGQRIISNGKIETCKMHDLLHDLCANKAKNEKLLCTSENFVRSNGNCWLSLKIVSQLFTFNIDLDKSRSILSFDMRKWNDPGWYLNSLPSLYYPLMVHSFKMLRVLDLTVITYYSILVPSGIIDVVLLRYLALNSNRLLTSIPVRRNRNLQTLVIREDKDGFHKPPLGIWELPQLRHLELYHQLSMYTPTVDQVNLQTLYWLQCLECTEQVFLRIPNVKELGIIIAQGCRCHRCLDNLICLNKLQKLKVRGSYCPINLPGTNFPQNLKNITFSKTLMPWEAMNVISMLPNLEVLKLKNDACVGQEWELTEQDGFRRLKLLLISVTDLEDWKVADDVDYPFPGLERLVLINCFELKKMPSWIEDLSINLKSIQFEHCYASLVSSAKTIEQENRDSYGEEHGFQILESYTQSEDLAEKDEDQNVYLRFLNSKLNLVSLCLCHSFAQEIDEDIKKCVFLKARSLYIPHQDNPDYWIWTRDSGHKVVELQRVCWLEIKGTLDTRGLLKMTCYSAYLVFKLKPRTQWLDAALTSVRFLKDKGSYSENRRCQVFLTKISEDHRQFSEYRDDGWMEIILGNFYISSGNEGDVEMRLWNTENGWKSGLVVKGIEVRPN